MNGTDAEPHNEVIGYAEWEAETAKGVTVCGVWLAEDTLCGRTGEDICPGGCYVCAEHCPWEGDHGTPTV